MTSHPHRVRFTATLTLLAAAALAPPPSAHAQCTPTFAPATTYAPDQAFVVRTMDLNLDGRLDIVTSGLSTGPNANAVNVMLNSGNGVFAAPVRHTISGTSGAVMASPIDTNNDGLPDLVLSLGSGSNSICFLRANGSGGFDTPIYFNMGGPQFSVLTADFNGDGFGDAAAVNSSTGELKVIYSNSSGGLFAPPVTFPGASFASAAGDFNGDGLPDIAVRSATSSNSIAIWHGTGLVGAGAFTVGATYTVPSPDNISVADLDGDGALDLAVGTGSSRVVVLRGTGDGTFTDAGTYNVPEVASSIAFADLNGDAKLDLAVGSSSGGSFYVFNGTGVLAPGSALSPAVPFPTGGTGAPRGIAAGDFNGDGPADLAVSKPVGGSLIVRLNTSVGFARPVITQQPEGTVAAHGESVQFYTAATGFGPALTYTWRRNGVPLSNGGNISGADTPILTINPATQADVARYSLRVSSPPACGGTPAINISNTAVLGITPGGVCVADLGVQGGGFGRDGALDNNDFIAFIEAFFSHTGCP